jgi:Tol biopolymer transport system component
MRRLIVLATVAAMSLLGLVTLGGAAAQATTPGKNGLIVFSADTGAGHQLYTIKANGSGLRQLTNLNGDAVAADWSPDGRRITFELGTETHAGIMIMNADGSGLRDLTQTGFQGQPAFTPDGHHLVYDCGDCPGGQGIFIIRDDGTGRRRLTTSPFPDRGFDTDPNVSPDGKTVTFVRAQVAEELQALYAVNIDGTNERQLTPYTLEVAIKHDWAPNGRRIVLTTNADYPNNQSPNVATIRSDGSHLRLLTHLSDGQRGAFAGSYSPNGRWIAMRVENRETQRFALVKIHPDGSGRKLIARLPFSPRFIDWGPRPSHRH